MKGISFFDYRSDTKHKKWINLERADLIRCNPVTEYDIKNYDIPKNCFDLTVYFSAFKETFYIDSADLAKFEKALDTDLL